MANFMDCLAYGGRRTWRDLCQNETPSLDGGGCIAGPWGDAIVAAVQCEKRGEGGRYEDGPAGQVLEFMAKIGHGKHMRAAAKTEEEAHAGRRHISGAAAATECVSSAGVAKPVCKYGPTCYRKNPEHFAEFAHPWLEAGGLSTAKAAGGKPSGYSATKPPAAAVPKTAGYGGARPPVAVAKPIGHGGAMPVAVAVPMRPSSAPGLVPTIVHGRPPKPTGRNRALLVGINYFGSRAELRGCINDVHNMRRLLTETFGWRNSDIRTLTDDDRRNMPTQANIQSGLRWLVEGAQSGDVLFFHFSGHGAQKEDPHGYEEDGMNETILPVDFERAGQMTDDEIGDVIVKPLPEGVKLTSVMDCCHSGTGLDLPFQWTGRSWKEETNPFYSKGDVQMFSGCEDDDTSSDASTAYGAAGGAMTTAFCDVLRAHSCPSYPRLMQLLHSQLGKRGFRQRPQLTSSQQFHFDRPFLLGDILPNSNPEVGRAFRRKFPPNPRKIDGPLADMLGLGVAVLGGMMLAGIAGDLLGF
eukprot:TRINITY_DN30389_c0_g1_i1.p1 TRINITY_DN30389_c0_g1~~TRINITY_DN30389_c0_g1_i1.p1  ORF type:complete len:524 (-),score=83.64 TRINITY_DN30389_c0_g1_i1:26-1597(-)